MPQLRFFIVLLLLIFSDQIRAQRSGTISSAGQSGLFSLGTRNTASLFTDDSGPGLGIGGQFRLQLSTRLNSEWYADYITSRNGEYTVRNDYHIGWSLMYYLQREASFQRLLMPYLIAGHCFDYSKVMSQANPEYYADRTSMATQAGAGMHVNISSRFDCSLAAQYMLHFGKEIHTEIEADAVLIEKHDYSSPHGHMLLTMSFNYKLWDLW